MRKLEIADTEVTQLAMRQEINRNEESRYDHRLLLVASGRSCTEVGHYVWSSCDHRATSGAFIV